MTKRSWIVPVSLFFAVAAFALAAFGVARVVAIGKRTNELRYKVLLLEILNDTDNSAMVDPAAANGFFIMDSRLGPFLGLLDDVEQHADGVRLHKRIENLSSALAAGCELRLKWGTRSPSLDDPQWKGRFAQWSEARDAWKQGLRERTVSIPDDLGLGVWTRITAALPDTKPEELGYLELSIDVQTVRMYTKE